MKSTAAYKRALTEIRALRQRAKYGAALAEVDALLKHWPDQPELLVLRGELIQLQDENGPPLAEAAAALKRALALGDRNAEAWLELGYFQFAVEDDVKAADKSFAQAIGARSVALVSALVGRAAALEELGRKREAFDCLSVARYFQSAGPTHNGAKADDGGLLDRWESLVGSG